MQNGHTFILNPNKNEVRHDSHISALCTSLSHAECWMTAEEHWTGEEKGRGEESKKVTMALGTWKVFLLWPRAWEWSESSERKVSRFGMAELAHSLEQGAFHRIDLPIQLCKTVGLRSTRVNKFNPLPYKTTRIAYTYCIIKQSYSHLAITTCIQKKKSKSLSNLFVTMPP